MVKTLLEERVDKVLFSIKDKGEEIEVVLFMRKENSYYQPLFIETK